MKTSLQKVFASSAVRRMNQKDESIQANQSDQNV